jgi:hypothetical protein
LSDVIDGSSFAHLPFLAPFDLLLGRRDLFHCFSAHLLCISLRIPWVSTLQGTYSVPFSICNGEILTEHSGSGQCNGKSVTFFVMFLWGLLLLAEKPVHPLPLSTHQWKAKLWYTSTNTKIGSPKPIRGTSKNKERHHDQSRADAHCIRRVAGPTTIGSQHAKRLSSAGPPIWCLTCPKTSSHK